MVCPNGDALLQERWYRNYRRSAYAGKCGTPRHLVGNGVTVLLLRAFLAGLIPCHSRHIVGGHYHRHGAHAHRHRHREGGDEGKKHADDRLRHERKGNAGLRPFQAHPRKGAGQGQSLDFGDDDELTWIGIVRNCDTGVRAQMRSAGWRDFEEALIVARTPEVSDF